jgi:putative transport protein
VFFVLFLFSIGYQTGPQFFRGLGRSALPQVGLALLLCGAVLASTFALARMFGFDAGAGAGLLAGGLNASAAIGTAGDAIGGLSADPATKQALATSLAVAFAVTYLVGLLTEIFPLTTVGPWLMRVDLAAECGKLEAEMGVASGDLGVSTYQSVVVRAYGVPAGLEGRSVTEVERSFAPARVFAERLRTPEGIVDPTPTTVLWTGQVLALSGRLAAHVDPANPLAGTEVDDLELLDIPPATVDVVLAAKGMVGRTLGEFAKTIGQEDASRSVFIRLILRGGKQVPFGPGTVVERGDVATLVGPASTVAHVAPILGHAIPPASSTDLLSMTIAIALGGLGSSPRSAWPGSMSGSACRSGCCSADSSQDGSIRCAPPWPRCLSRCSGCSIQSGSPASWRSSGSTPGPGSSAAWRRPESHWCWPVSWCASSRTW